jgi:hypothetical protein
VNTTLLDLLGCAGHLQVAEDMINFCPMWRALLGACRIHGDVEMKEMVIKQVLEVDLDNASGYVLLGTGSECKYSTSEGKEHKETARK